MRKIKLILTSIITMFILLIPLNAASFGLTSSTKNVKPGGTFTINVGGDCIGRVNLTVSNGILSTNSVWVEMGYTSVTVTAGASGQVTITASPVTGFSDSDANEYNPGSRTIKVNISSTSGSKPIDVKPKSSDNNLSSISITNGELSPAFDKNQSEYKVDLKGDVTKITIDAKAVDEKSKIEGLGEKDVHPGNNYFEIIVTAENGDKKTYKINAYVDETPEVYLDYGKEKIGIVRNYEGVQIPEGFTLEELTIDNKIVSVFTKDKLNIIYGLNENNEKSFYVINKDTNEIINKIIVINISGKMLYVINDDDNKVTINEMEVACKELESNYCILKTINTEEKVIDYLYEISESGIVKYPSFLNNIKDNSLKDIIIYILSALLIVNFVAILVYKIKKGGKYEKTK